MSTPETAAVRIWRDTFQLNTSEGFKADIEATVGPDGEKGLRLWRSLLDHWGYFKKGKWVQRNKFDVKAQLNEYEELIRHE